MPPDRLEFNMHLLHLKGLYFYFFKFVTIGVAFKLLYFDNPLYAPKLTK